MTTPTPTPTPALPPVKIVYRMEIPKLVPGFMKERYPYQDLRVGEAIFVPYQRAGFENLMTCCRERNKRRDGRMFYPVKLEGGNHAIVRRE